jgi:hypothetical protein
MKSSSFNIIIKSTHNCSMKNLRNISKYIDVKKFKPRPLDTV